MINFIQENFYALLVGAFIINWTFMILTGKVGRTDFKYKNMLFKISRWFFEIQGLAAIVHTAWHLRFLMKGYGAFIVWAETGDIDSTIRAMLIMAIGTICLVFANSIKNSSLVEKSTYL